MRLLLVSQDFPPDVGGIETYASEMAKRLSDRCEKLVVVAPRRPGAEATDCALPFTVHRLPGRRDLLGLAALPVVPVLARRYRLSTALHAQWATVFASLLARRLTGFPRRIGVAAHGRELLFQPSEWPPARRFYDDLRRRALGGADVLLPVSQYTADLLRTQGGPDGRITVVSNGTDPDRFFPDAEAGTAFRQQLGGGAHRPILLSVGRLVARKGVDTTLRALPRIADIFPEVMYLVAGAGPDRPRLERMARQQGVAERVRFLGRVPSGQLRPLYSAADVFVMPSRQTEPDVEGFGIVFLEAAACGTPAVGGRTGGIPDAIDSERTGLLVPPDDPGALAAACERLLGNPGLAERFGEAARRRVERHFSWNHVAARLYAALQAGS